MRYEHYLYGARPSPWPKAMIALSCDVKWRQDDTKPEREWCELSSWSVALCTQAGKDYVVSRKASGTTADGFWALLTTASQRCTNLWIITSRFRECAAVLDLWGRMESGHVRIAGTDSRPGGGASRPMSDLRATVQTGQSGDVAALDRDNLRPMRGGMDATEGIPTPAGKHRKKARPGICILEDPPIVMVLRLDGSQYKITWADVANYGIDIPASEPGGKSASSGLAEWFIAAASTLHSFGRVGWQATAGSQAMHLFRSVYLETPILSHTEPNATALESRAMFGGRCECFALGRIPGPVHLFDFRSLYPYLCGTTAVPVRLARVVHDPGLESLALLQEMGLVIADVEVETDEPDYPYRDGFSVTYPVGRFVTTLAGAELDHAKGTGAIRGIRGAAVYETEYALKRYAEELYAIRQLSDSRRNIPLAAWIKRLMVALPGKFGQRIAAWEDMPDAECPWEWAEWYTKSKSGEPERWRVIAGHIQRETRGGFSHGAIPAISAAICSAGRDRLRNVITAAGREHVYYCDTDSVIVDDYGREALTLADWVRPGEWGYLQHVVSADEAEICGVKHYRIGERVRESGRAIVGAKSRIGAAGSTAQPWIGQSLRKQSAPADWRETHPYLRGLGRYDQQREPGGRVKPPTIMEW